MAPPSIHASQRRTWTGDLAPALLVSPAVLLAIDHRDYFDTNDLILLALILVPVGLYVFAPRLDSLAAKSTDARAIGKV